MPTRSPTCPPSPRDTLPQIDNDRNVSAITPRIVSPRLSATSAPEHRPTTGVAGGAVAPGADTADETSAAGFHAAPRGADLAGILATAHGHFLAAEDAHRSWPPSARAAYAARLAEPRRAPNTPAHLADEVEARLAVAALAVAADAWARRAANYRRASAAGPARHDVADRVLAVRAEALAWLAGVDLGEPSDDAARWLSAAHADSFALSR